MLNRRLLMAQAKAGPVYPGYKIVSYIEATGKQYAEYDNQYKALTYFDAIFQRTNLTESEGVVINNFNVPDQCRTTYFYALKNIYAGWGKTPPIRIYYPAADLEKHKARIENGVVYLDELSAKSVDVSSTPSKVYILGVGNTKSFMRLYELNLKRADGTEIHLRPVVRELDAKPGLLDTETLEFYPSATKEDFLYG